MVQRSKMLSLVLAICIGVVTIAFAITIGQTDNFQDGSLNSWMTGLPNPNPPINVGTGGPDGISDKYMRLTSSGTLGAGSKLVVFNSSQWQGNYISAGVTNIRMDLKNEGSNALQMRIALFGPTGSCSSINAIQVPVGSGWIKASFPITSADLIGGDVNTILSNVTELRLLHKTIPGTSGDVITAQLGVDNITASNSPVLPLAQGWNLVSIPLLQSDYSADVVFTGKAGSMFSYNTTTRSYQTAATLTNGPGFWVNYPIPITIVFSGNSPGTKTVTVSQSGWVLVGSSDTALPTSLLVLNGGATILGSIFHYNAAAKSYQATTVINPGEAVWMNISAPCTITIP